MSEKPTPWDEIQAPDREYNVRLITEPVIIPLYWGKDMAGRCLFILELIGDHREQFRKSTTQVQGIDIDLRTAATGQRLVLTLEQQVDKDIFLSFCEALIARLSAIADPADVLAVSMLHIQRWKIFMANRKSLVLSAQEIRGLFAELYFLRLLYKGSMDEKEAVDAWVGPENRHQDFIFGNTAVEIKSISGVERSTVRISSEDQLESLCDRLFLVVLHLASMPGSERAISLNALVRIVQEELSNATAVEILHQRLAAHGYIEKIEYDTPEFAVVAESAYSVSEGFPRLVRSLLPDGLVRVSYEIELEKIHAFKCDLASVMES